MSKRAQSPSYAERPCLNKRGRHSIDGAEMIGLASATETPLPLRACDTTSALALQRTNSWPFSRSRNGSRPQPMERTVRSLIARARFKAAAQKIISDLKVTGSERSSIDTGTQRKLCRLCIALDLTRSDFVCQPDEDSTDDNVPLRKAHKYRLGTLQSLFYRAFSCRLCHLIVDTLTEQVPVDGRGAVSISKNGHPIADEKIYCELCWQVDGLEALQRSKDGTAPSAIPKTRRLHVQWRDKRFADCYLIMMYSPSKPGDGAFLGRPIDPSKEGKENLIRKWLELCKKTHSSTCHGNGSPEEAERFEELRKGPYFGVIDVHEMCFKALPKDAEYVTLSYYWGATHPQRFCTTRKTVLSIKERNGLSKYFDELPKTVRDTIELVRNLGLRYLWVDCLCLVTDLKDAWDRNAAVMDLVYGQACLTICATEGDDADAGLRTLHQPAVPKQHIADYNSDVKLLARFPLETYVSRSKWNSRAWTFQEHLFSRRCLIFAQGRMYLECCTTALSEDVDLESTNSGWSLDFEQSHKRDWKCASGDIVSSYVESVALYTAMDLPKPTERLEAFKPIGKLIFSRLGGHLIFGLPNTHFDWALLWTPQDDKVRDERRRNNFFPSWSWCGWDGAIMYKDSTIWHCMENLHDWLVKHTWITWYIRDGNGNLRLVWDPSLHGSKGEDVHERWQGYTGERAASAGFDHYGRKIPKPWIGLPRNEFNRALPDFPVQVRTLDVGEKSSQIVGRAEDLPYLQFWTWMAYFWLELSPSDSTTQHTEDDGREAQRHRHALHRYIIRDESQEWVGETTVSSRWNFDAERPQPFIAISDARWGPNESMAKDAREASKYKNSWSDTWPFYHVLLLDYNADDADASGDLRHKIAYRVGLGKVLRDGFDHGVLGEQRTNKEWKEIVMG